MLIGLIRKDGSLQTTDRVLNEAALFGEVDGYPLSVLAGMLNTYKTKGPSASQIASVTWRRAVLERIVDYYTYPESQLPLLRGSLVHKGLEGISLPSSVPSKREIRLRSYLPHHKSIMVSGQIDIYYPEQRRLEDYKTCTRIPESIKDDHLVQLAVYYWLLKWSGEEVERVAIDYIGWDVMQQIDIAEMPDGSIAKAIEHPYFQDMAMFETIIKTGYDVLEAGFNANVVPSMGQCNYNYCRYCPLKWACDRILATGETIDPEDYKQEDYT